MSNINECSITTKLSNEYIISSISKIDIQIAIELEEPWDSIPIKSEKFPHHLINISQQLVKLKKDFGINYFYKNEYTIKNHTRIFTFIRNSEFEDFNKHEYIIPNNELHYFIQHFIDFYLLNNDNLKKWEIFEFKNHKEIFICTHKNRDQCCGKYGFELYEEFDKHINKNYSSHFRIWRSSHIGGHRYAPTFYEAPSMRWYGLFEKNNIPSYLNREKSIFKIENYYRGTSGIVNKYALLAENELFKKYSWDWLNFLEKNYEVRIIDKNLEIFEIDFYYKLKSFSEFTKSTFIIKYCNTIQGISSCNNNDRKPIKQYEINEIIL